MTILFNGKYAQKMFRYICIKIVTNIFGSFDSDGRKIKQNSDSPYSQMNCEDYASKILLIYMQCWQLNCKYELIF